MTTRFSKKFYYDIDLNKNYLRKASFENLAEHPDNALPGQVYYNTVQKCFYFYHEIPAAEPGGQSTFEWVDFVRVRDLTDLLKDHIVEGEGVVIERINDQLRISADFKNTAYEGDFKASEFVNGVLTIPAYNETTAPNGHKCGTHPVLATIMERTQLGYQCIEVGFAYDLQGNVSIYSSEPFDGYIQMNSPYQGAASVEGNLDQILYGPVQTN